jgi:hypothetical protein
LIVAHVADPAAGGSNPDVGAWEGERVSRNASELVSASLHQPRVASPSETVKPASAGKERSNAPAGLSGVIGGGARGKSGQELGRPVEGVG